MGDLVADAARGDRDLTPLGTVGRLAGAAAVGAVDRAVAVVARSRLPELVIDRLLEARVADRVVDRLLETPYAARLLTETLERPEVERLLVQVLDSAEMQRVIERVANSPEIRAAVAAQSIGLADEVAEQVRTRAIAGDAAAERLARRLLRRRAEP